MPFLFLLIYAWIIPRITVAGSVNVGLPVVSGTGPGTSPASFINYLVIFSFVFVSAAAVIMLVAGGIGYLTSAGNAGRESDAKDRITSALLGALVIFAAIAILYTLNPDFVRLRNPGIPIIELPDIAAVQPRVAGSCTLLGAGWDISQSCQNETTKKYDLAVMAVRAQDCADWGVAFNITDASGATIATKIATFSSDYLTVSWQPERVGIYRFTATAGSGDTLTRASSGQLNVVNPPCINLNPSSGRCVDPNLVCTATICPALVTSQWYNLIPGVAAQYPIGGGVNTEKFLQSIMRIESQGAMDVYSCQRDRNGQIIPDPTGKYSRCLPLACGIMQFKPATATGLASRCGINHAISCDWLLGWPSALQVGEDQTTVANASICMASQYIQDILNGTCYLNQGQIRDLAAGYNGGGECNAANFSGNALAKSVSCANDLDCSNRPTLRYECLHDDVAHTKCNVGFRETRDYVAKFNRCYSL